MKQDRARRRVSAGNRRTSSASAILAKGGGSNNAKQDYLTYGWLLLIITFITITMISFLFTPYTHQLDEIKNVLLMLLPPFILIAALWKMDFSSITWKHNGALILLGLYFLWMCISWLVNPYKEVGETVIWFNLGVSTFALVFAWFMNTEEKVRKTMIFFVILGLVSTVLGLFLYAGRYTEHFYEKMLQSSFWQTPENRPWATLVYTLTSSHADMYSFILNSDFYAAFLVMLIPIALSMFFVEQRTWYKVMALAAVLLMNVCLFLTNSNDSFIAMFLVSYPLYFLLGWKYVRGWGISRRVLVTFGACTAVALIFIVIMMLPKLSSTYNFKSAAFEGRKVLWGGGFWPWIYGDNLQGQGVDFISVIFGTGPGGYRHYFPWFRRPDFFDQQINNVTTFSHNFYLDVLLETGLVGLMLFVGFVVRVFADGFRQIRTTESRTHRFYQLAILVGLAGIAVQNYSSPNNRWAVAAMIYWSMFGLSIGLVNVENPPVPGLNRDKKIGSLPIYKLAWWGSLGLAALFFLRCVIPGAGFYNYWKGATENAEGLRDMDYATWPGQSAEDQFAFLLRGMGHMENAIDYNPTFATSYYKLGHIYNRISQSLDNPVYSEKAIRTYELLDAVNANYSEVHLNLGIMYAQKSSNVEQYRQKLEQEIERMKEEMGSSTSDRQKQLQKDIELGSRALEKMEGLESGASETKELHDSADKVTLRLLQTSYDHFRQAAHQSLKPNTQYFAASTGRELAALYAEAGETEKAAEINDQIKKYYRSIIDYKPMLPEVQADQKAYYSRSQQALLALEEETGDTQGVISVLKLMVHDNPENELMLQALLEAYDRAEKPGEKLEYLEDAVHADPTDAMLRRDLANAYKSDGQTDKYLAELRRVEVLQPNDVALLQEIQQGYDGANNAARANEYTEKLKKLGALPADEATSGTAEAAEAGATTETVTGVAPSTASQTVTTASEAVSAITPTTTPVTAATTATDVRTSGAAATP